MGLLAVRLVLTRGANCTTLRSMSNRSFVDAVPVELQPLRDKLAGELVPFVSVRTVQPRTSMNVEEGGRGERPLSTDAQGLLRAIDALVARADLRFEGGRLEPEHTPSPKEGLVDELETVIAVSHVAARALTMLTPTDRFGRFTSLETPTEQGLSELTTEERSELGRALRAVAGEATNETNREYVYASRVASALVLCANDVLNTKEPMVAHLTREQLVERSDLVCEVITAAIQRGRDVVAAQVMGTQGERAKVCYREAAGGMFPHLSANDFANMRGLLEGSREEGFTATERRQLNQHLLGAVMLDPRVMCGVARLGRDPGVNRDGIAEVLKRADDSGVRVPGGWTFRNPLRSMVEGALPRQLRQPLDPSSLIHQV